MSRISDTKPSSSLVLAHPSGEHHPCGHHGESRFGDLVLHQDPVELLDAALHDVRHIPHRTGIAPPPDLEVDGLVLDLRVAEEGDLPLDLLRFAQGDPQHTGHVVGQVISPDGDHGQATRSPLREHRHSRGAPSDIHRHGSGHGLLRGKGTESGSQGLDDQPVDLKPRPFHAVQHVLQSGGGDDHRLEVDFQPHARHAQGVVDAPVTVQGILHRDGVEHRLVRRDGHLRLRRFDDPLHVELHHRPGCPSEGHHALGAHAHHVAAAEGHGSFGELQAHHVLGVRHGLLHRSDGLVEVDDQPFADSLGRGMADADNLGLPGTAFPFGDHNRHLARPEIKPHEQFRVSVGRGGRTFFEQEKPPRLDSVR